MTRRIVWIAAALLLFVSACADIWGFQDFPSGPNEDASVDAASNGDAGSHGDATLDARDSGHRDGAGDARDADADVDAACPIGTCNGKCIDTMTDPKNCGGCGTVCTAGAPCQGGMCMCPGNEHICGAGDAGACVSTMSDEANCGGCNVQCAMGATCVNSACVCPTSQKVCGTGAGAICVDLQSDPANCGSCGTTCGDTASCSGGMCLPCGAIATQAQCGAPVHCVDNATDPKNCGGCGTTCLASQVCAKSKCICPGSKSLCGTATTGVCYDLSVNAKNCGACGNACLGGTICQGGNCVCPAGTHSCGTGAAATCLSNTSTSSCGTGSCSVCPIPAGGTTTCNGMTCGDVCGNAALPTLCPPGGGANAACVNTTTDPNHCGGCGTPCSTANATESCTGSTCAVSSCGNGFANCDKLASTGCEIDTAHDTSNCGSCTHACPMSGAAEVCTNGVCAVSTCKVAGTVDCDGNAANGCEVNITNDVNNCGGCGKACSTNNATEACASSKCTITACSAGFVDCDKSAANGCEINTTKDPSNCGGCGKTCSQAGGTGTCAGSTCAIACDTGFADCDHNVANGCETAITTTSNCGVCGNVCSTTNATEACSSTSAGYACSVTSCNAGFDDCDHKASTGCEINQNTDPLNCGGCGQACSTAGGASEKCQKGICSSVVCTDPTRADCNGVAKDGCETLINTPSHCGDCNTSCSTNNVAEVCSAPGTASPCSIPPNGCKAGFSDCDKDPTNGCEVNTAADTSNCGTCGHLCTSAGGVPTCTSGTCGVVCSVPNADCDKNAANGCEVNTSSDPSHCGSCTTPCNMSNATEVCSSSACSIMSCAAGFSDCDKNVTNGCETNTGADTKNCGTCGNKCSTANGTAGCSGGACSITCSSGFMDCNANVGDGCEVHTAADPLNCGTCGHACSMVGGTQGCSGGTCGGLVCMSPMADCDVNSGNGCEVNTSNDPNNCGACATKCSTNNATEVCTSSKCAIQSCAAGFADCNSSATDGCEVNTTTDASNCNGCGKACSQIGGTGTCVGAACKIACGVGFADCDLNVANGCEINTTNNTENCGTCGNKCSMNNATENCTASKCTIQSCAAGFADCDTSAANGCEANTNGDANNCGGCGMKCSTSNAVEVCSSGACSVMSCSAGFADCDHNPANGCEVNLTTDAANCGSCGTACSTNNATETCTAMVCAITACTTGFKDCDGMAANGCEADTSTDPQNCGACGTKCNMSGGTETCSGGHCAMPVCTAPFANCDGDATNGCEVDTSKSVTNCGACGAACSMSGGTETCSAGHCSMPVCAAPFANCDLDPANGCEVNTSNDPKNCSACGAACPTGVSCTGSSCGMCPAGTMNCMNSCVTCPTQPSGGSLTCTGATCSESCPSTLTLCNANLASAACVNTSNDAANCNGCGLQCTGGQTCVSSACQCPAGQTFCGGACVNTATDSNNCGGCGISCVDAGLTTCVAGGCL